MHSSFHISNTLNLNKINTYLVEKFMYNIHHGIVPDILEGMFV